MSNQKKKGDVLAVKIPEDHEGDAASDSDGDERRPTSYIYNTPGFMNAVMRRQVLHEMVKMLPGKVQNRVRALKNIQLEQLKFEAEFYEEVYNLEKKYHIKYQPLFDKRKNFVSGEQEPNDNEEANWKSDNEETEMTEKMKDISLKLQKNMHSTYPEDVRGIPDFWLTIFRSTEILSEMVQEHDEPVLKKLKDIKIIYGDDKEQSYTLEFHFDKNEYFSNPVLTKQYFLKASIDEEYPFSFEGPEIYKCKGCTINWEKSCNLTIKTIRKKQKHKARGAVRTITKQVPNDSFFNFFNPPEVSEDKEKIIDEESQSILATDFEIGHFLRARIIPKAVLYYTGDIVDDDDEDDFDEEEEEEENEEEEEESDDEHQHKQAKTGPKKMTPNDCPNQ